MNERLSAFLDGEATGDEIDSALNELLRDESMRATWSRQHWIRTTLRASDTEAPIAMDMGFADRVMGAIESDRITSDRITSDNRTETVVAMDPATTSTRITRRSRRRVWQGMAGMGMAAAVVGVVVVSNNPFATGNSRGNGPVVASNDNTTTRTSRPSSTTRVADTTSRRNTMADTRAAGFGNGDWNEALVDFATVRANNAAAANVRTVSTQQSRDTADRWSSVNDPAVRDELNGYLVDHNGMARGYGMSSTTPAYVRVATYGQGGAQ